MEHYVALPEGQKAPGLVLIQEIFGVNRPMRSIADAWAGEGFVCMAPDLFWRLQPGVDLGYSAEDWEKAIDYMNRFDIEKGIEDLGTTIKKLKAHPQCNGKVAVMGFCLGGLLAYLTAAAYDIDAAISFYGVKIDDHLSLKPKIKCPVQFHYGMVDEHVPMERIERVKAAYPDSVYLYPETGHGFYNRDRDEYSEKAAKEAHKHCLELLSQL